MNHLIFQVHIKQWDKGQRSPADSAARAAQPDRLPIAAAPQYQVLNCACVVDQHGDDLATNKYPRGRLQTSMLADGSILLDRFQVSRVGEKLMLAYRDKQAAPVELGCLNDGWIQARYQWRYSVEQGGALYWLYEEVILNAALVESYEADHFLTRAPQLSFEAPAG